MTDWFDVLGSHVPYHRRARAEALLLDEYDWTSKETKNYIDEIANAIEADRPQHAISAAREKLPPRDTIVAYRVLAVLLADQQLQIKVL